MSVSVNCCEFSQAETQPVQTMSEPSSRKPWPTSDTWHLLQTKHSLCQWRLSNDANFVVAGPSHQTNTVHSPFTWYSSLQFSYRLHIGLLIVDHITAGHTRCYIIYFWRSTLDFPLQRSQFVICKETFKQIHLNLLHNFETWHLQITKLCKPKINFQNLLFLFGWLGGTTGSASDQRSEGCGFEAY